MKMNTLYVLQAELHKGEINVVQKDADIDLSHKWLSHISEKGMQLLARKSCLPNL